MTSTYHNTFLCLLVQKVCGARGWGESDPNYANTRDTLRTLWSVLTSRADTDHDKQVSDDSYCYYYYYYVTY